MKYTFIPDSGPNTLIRVHKAGCRNIEKAMRHANSKWDIEANSPEEAIKIQEQDFIDQDMGAFDYQIEHCAKEVNQ